MCKVSRLIYVLTLAISLAAMATALDVSQSLTSIIDELDKNALTLESTLIADPLAKFGNAALCKPLTRILVPETEPDTSELTLLYQTPEVKIIFKLATAAEQIVQYIKEYSPSKKVCIWIHGFTDNPTKINFQTFNNAMRAAGESCIVLGLDASSVISKDINYITAAAAVKFVGIAQGAMLAALYFLTGHLPELFHCIGHSLGAHVCAYVAYTFYSLTGLNLGRVTGLDPAGPCFVYLPNDMKFNTSAGEFNDVYHTNAGALGIDEIVGQANFIINDGSQQPGCVTQSCCHSRAPEIFADSVVNPGSFLARRCNNYQDFRNGNCSNETCIMGYSCPTTTSGIFYVQTKGKVPFGLGEEGTHYNKDEEGLLQQAKNELKDIGHSITDKFKQAFS